MRSNVATVFTPAAEAFLATGISTAKNTTEGNSRCRIFGVLVDWKCDYSAAVVHFSVLKIVLWCYTLLAKN